MELTATAKEVRSRKEAWKAYKSSKVKNEIDLTGKRILGFRKCCTHGGYDPYVLEYLHNTRRVKVKMLLTGKDNYREISKSLGKGTKGTIYRGAMYFLVMDGDVLLQAIQECTVITYTYWDSKFVIPGLVKLFYSLRDHLASEDVDEEYVFDLLLKIANLTTDELYWLAKTKYPWVFKEEEQL
jgi:hypothetical protein